MTAGTGFRRVWTASTAETLGVTVAGVALPLVATADLGASAFEVSLLTAASAVPVLLFGLPAGMLVDRWAPRPIILVCDALMAVVLLSVAGAAGAGFLTYGHLLTAAFAAGTLAVVLALAYRTVLPAVVPFARLPQAAGRMQATEWTARAGGPGLAGLIVQAAGAAGGALFAALTALTSLACIAGLPPISARPARRTGPRPAGGVLAGARFVLTDRLLRSVTACTALAAGGRGMLQAAQVVFLIRELGLSEGTAGLLLSAVGVGGVLGALVAPRVSRRFGTGRGLLLTQLGTAPLALLVPLAEPGPGIALFVVGSLGVGTGLVAGNVVTAGWRLTYCPPELLGRVTAATLILVNGALPLGALAGGVAASLFGVRAALAAGAVVLLLAAAGLAAGPVRVVRDLPQRDPDPVPLT